MFGYVVFNQQELKVKDYEMYRSWYCGLCRELRERYGIPGQLSISYDMTFVVLLLTALYEPRSRKGKTRCIIHPAVPHTVRKNLFTEYAADMNLVLMYYKCMDDWVDDQSFVRLGYAKILKSGMESLLPRYQEKISRIKSLLSEISRLEHENCQDLDQVSGTFGKLLAEVLAPRHDEWEASLRRIGFYLGKFIYLLDAYEDVDKDILKGSYNPLTTRYQSMNLEAFEEDSKKLLTMMLVSACQEFERLPILRYGDILRNILYSGVWTRFTKVSKKRREEKHA